MKTKLRVVILAIGFIISANQSYGQVKDLGNFMAGGIDDANMLFEAYLSPHINALGAGLSGGWYNTAKPHKLGGFDITFSTSVGIIPSSDRSFNVDELGLNTLRLASGEVNTSPTLAGDKGAGPYMAYNLPVGLPEVRAFRLPQGSGFPATVSPMIQAGLGLVKGTEVIGRYMPKTKLGGLSIDMWGIGVKHSLKQWIPVLSKMPVFNLSLFGGYTVLNSNTKLSVLPSNLGAENYAVVYDGTFSVATGWEGQSMDIIIKSFTANILVSANLPVVCFYGAAGIAKTDAELGLKGFYPIVNAVEEEVYPTSDPLKVKVKSQDGGVTKPRLNAGIRFKFAVITLHFDYTYANYSVATAGLGISIR